MKSFQYSMVKKDTMRNLMDNYLIENPYKFESNAIEIIESVRLSIGDGFVGNLELYAYVLPKLIIDAYVFEVTDDVINAIKDIIYACEHNWYSKEFQKFISLEEEWNRDNPVFQL